MTRKSLEWLRAHAGEMHERVQPQVKRLLGGETDGESSALGGRRGSLSPAKGVSAKSDAKSIEALLNGTAEPIANAEVDADILEWERKMREERAAQEQLEREISRDSKEAEQERQAEQDREAERSRQEQERQRALPDFNELDEREREPVRRLLLQQSLTRSRS